MWTVLSAKTAKPIAKLSDKFETVEAGANAGRLLNTRPPTLPLLVFAPEEERQVTRLTQVGPSHPDYDEALARWLAQHNMILSSNS